MHDEDDDVDRPKEGARPVEIPLDALSPAAIAGVIEAFVLREGTDYGARETEHATKTAQVRAQLTRGEAKIVFDPSSQSVTLLTLAEFRRVVGEGD